MIYRKPAWFLENPHDRDRICFLILLSSVSVLLHTSQYKYAPVVFWFAVRLEKKKLLFPCGKKPYILTIMHLKVYILVWVEVWEFLPFYFIYYIYGCSTPPPLVSIPPPILWSHSSPLPHFSQQFYSPNPRLCSGRSPRPRPCPCIIFRPSIPSLFPLPSPFSMLLPLPSLLALATKM